MEPGLSGTVRRYVTHAEAIALLSRLLPEIKATPVSAPPNPTYLAAPQNAPIPVTISTPPAIRRSAVPDPLIYHLPIPPHLTSSYTPTTHTATQLVFSLTATSGIYAHLSPLRHRHSILFLHRPWDLIRSSVPCGTLVLQSHVRFDELYTTGFNEAFARGHHVDVTTAVCLQGYKGDHERRIGLVGRVARGWRVDEYACLISDAFQGAETIQLHGGSDRHVEVLASLNAFTSEVVDRVVAAAADLGVRTTANIMILTGAAKGREDGMEAALQAGIAVVAVGHRRSEMWGLRYLASSATKKYAGKCEVVVVDEPDEEEERARQRDQAKRRRAEERLAEAQKVRKEKQKKRKKGNALEAAQHVVSEQVV